MPPPLAGEQLYSGFACTLWIHDDNIREDVIFNPDRVPGEILAVGKLARMATYSSTRPSKSNRGKIVRSHRKNSSDALREWNDDREMTNQKGHDYNESVTIRVDEDSGRTESRNVNRESSFLFSPSLVSTEMKAKQAALEVNMRQSQ